MILVTDAGETTAERFDAARKRRCAPDRCLHHRHRPIKTKAAATRPATRLGTLPIPWVGYVLPDSATELDSIFDRINRELRTQYRLGYYPTPRGPQHYRRLRLKCPQYQVRHRNPTLPAHNKLCSNVPRPAPQKTPRARCGAVLRSGGVHLRHDEEFGTY